MRRKKILKLKKKKKNVCVCVWGGGGGANTQKGQNHCFLVNVISTDPFSLAKQLVPFSCNHFDGTHSKDLLHCDNAYFGKKERENK